MSLKIHGNAWSSKSHQLLEKKIQSKLGEPSTSKMTNGIEGWLHICFWDINSPYSIWHQGAAGFRKIESVVGFCWRIDWILQGGSICSRSPSKKLSDIIQMLPFDKWNIPHHCTSPLITILLVYFLCTCLTY